MNKSGSHLLPGAFAARLMARIAAHGCPAEYGTQPMQMRRNTAMAGNDRSGQSGQRLSA